MKKGGGGALGPCQVGFLNLLQNSFSIGGADGEAGADYALEKMGCDRYEGDETRGTYRVDTDIAAAVMGEKYPGLGHRPFKWEMVNDSEPE